MSFTTFLEINDLQEYDDEDIDINFESRTGIQPQREEQSTFADIRRYRDRSDCKESLNDSLFDYEDPDFDSKQSLEFGLDLDLDEAETIIIEGEYQESEIAILERENCDLRSALSLSDQLLEERILQVRSLEEQKITDIESLRRAYPNLVKELLSKNDCHLKDLKDHYQISIEKIHYSHQRLLDDIRGKYVATVKLMREEIVRMREKGWLRFEKEWKTRKEMT